ncbi:unnamed protein product [Cuscuta epithymum]|uniref:EGF-like domain-containing protein n=1 Tax=Cuscuta epithymum TaxID=186058 RepID=A0AAV0GDR3_9ASTE|nr:unnamed protein product [Cuscuta epithymum]CAH9145385.1 unnamed protein product [Cuscuta epithymum]
MASSVHFHSILALTVLAVLLPWPATSDIALPPLLSSIFDNVCDKGGLCGKGKCKESTNSVLGYECECAAGWKQTRSQNDTFFKFMPCVIPNCSVNYSCGEGEAPAPAPAKRADRSISSISDPCNWADCGGGKCKRNSTLSLTYTCECNEGYFNLLNSTALPCVRACALGMDCNNLGFGLPNNSSTPPSPSSSDSNEDKLCKKVGCGKGNCKASGNSILGYECECDPGWKQTLLQSDNSFKFLPCVIPNCSINFSCGEDAPAPAAPDKRANRTSFFEPCYWAECGGGSCMQTSALTYTCECSKGYSNLLNITGFPCFKECALGLDCNMTNKSSSPPTATPSLTHNNSNKASGFIDGGGLVLKSVAAVSVAMYFLK